MKKRKGNVKDESCNSILLISEEYVNSFVTNDLIHLLKKFQKAETVEEQVILMPQLVEYIKPPASYDMENIVKVLVHIFLSASLKHPLRKSIVRLLSNIQIHKEISNNITLELARQFIVEMMAVESEFDTLKEIDNENITQELKNINIIINNVNGCFENFQIGFNSLLHDTTEVFSFLCRSFSLFTDRIPYVMSPVVLQNLYQFIHNTTRAMISMSQQMPVRHNVYKMYKFGINKRCVAIMNNINIPYDTKSNCGIIMIFFANNTKENGYIDLLRMCLEPEIPWFIDEGLKGVTTEIGVISVFSGVLIVVKPDELMKGNSTYFYLITSKLTEILSCSENDPTVILGVNRTMLLVSKNIQDLSISHLMNLLNILLNYVWMNLDHSIDTVRHIAKSIFINLIKSSNGHKINGDNASFETIVKKTLLLPTPRSCRYRAISTLATEVGTKVLLESDQNLVEMLLKQMKNDSVSSEVMSCYESLMKAHVKEITEESWVKIWVTPLLECLSNDEKLNQNNKCLQDLLAMAIKLKPMLLQNIIPERNLGNTLEFCSLLHCALIARQLGKSSDSEQPHIWRGLLKPIILEQAKHHQNDEIRNSSLALITDSHKSTEIFSDWELSFIIKFISYNIGTQLPSVRQQIISLMRRILNRFNESYKLIRRNLNKTKKDEPDGFGTHKASYENFIQDLRKVAFENIFYGANFTRRSLALEMLTMMRPIYDTIPERWTEDEANLMLLCLTDSYENNKRSATNLLEQCPVGLLKFQKLLHTQNLLELAIKMTYNVRPSAPTTAAYMLETLMYSPVLPQILSDLMHIPIGRNYSKEYLMLRYLCIQMRCHYELAHSNLIAAVKTSPIHGIMFCVRHMSLKFFSKIKTDLWGKLLNEIIRICLLCSDVVSPIVKNSSPEGHLPMDQKPVELCESDQTVTSQMLLVCAWRTIKEISLLLSDVCLRAPIIDENKNGLISQKLIENIGEHFCKLLIEIRHRGAFEHAYLGFSKVLNRLWKCNTAKLNQLPIEWLRNIMQVVSGGNTSQMNLCITRRSAGLPFMIQAIVTTELLSGGSMYFQQTIKELIETGLNNQKKETRTHAMNILRALYRCTALGEMVMPFLANGFIVAINGFNKAAWSERNSATLLFASLMTRMFGVQRVRDMDNISVKNRMSVRMFHQRYPTLLPFLLAKLKEATAGFDSKEIEDQEVLLYPILNILSRLYPVGLEEEVIGSLNEFVPYVTYCARGRMLKTRELAAKALASIVNETSKLGLVNELLIRLEQVQNNNYLHGMLLQIHQLIKDIPDIENSVYITNVVEATRWIITVPCPIVSALYMQILIQLPLKAMGTHTNSICVSLLEDVDSVIQNDETLTSTVCLRSAFYLKLHLIGHIMSINLEVRCLKLQEVVFHKFTLTTPALYNFALNFLIYLFSDNRSSIVIKSWDIPPEEKLLADLFPEAMRINLLTLISADLDTLRKTLHPFLKHSDITASKTLAVLSHVPTIFNKINLIFYKNNVSYIINMVRDQCDNNMTCASLMCLKNIGAKEFSKNMLKYMKILWEFSDSNYNVACRYIVTEIIIDNVKYLMNPQEKEVEEICLMWQVVLKLLGDTELVIRNKISELTLYCFENSLPVIPDRAREILLQYFVDTMSPISEEKCIIMLLYWVFDDYNNSMDDDEQYDGQIFEKNDQGNTFVENQLLSKLAVKKLPQFFVGKEQNFFSEIQELVEKPHIFWKVTQELKTILSYYNKKIDFELKRHGDFNIVKMNIKNSFDFWTDGEDAIRWKYLDILQCFISSK